MKAIRLNLDRHEQLMLKQVLTSLIDNDSGFQMPSLTEHACGVHESEKWIRNLTFLSPKRQIQMQYYQLTVLWKILISYPAAEEEINGIRLLLNHIDKHYLTIQNQLNYETIPEVRQSVANLLADNYSSNAY